MLVMQKGEVMALNKVTGKGVSLSTHSWNPIQGCSHDCVYCYARAMKKRFRQSDEVGFKPELLKDKLGNGNTIFVGSVSDLGGEWVKRTWLEKTLYHCSKFDNTYWFLTKNPGGLIPYVEQLPEKSILGVTLETNRDYKGISKAVSTEQRATDFLKVLRLNEQRKHPCKIMVCMEPLLDFDTVEYAQMVHSLKPDFTYIGLNSGKAEIPEPPEEKLRHLYESLLAFSDVMVKDKLAKIIGVQPGLNEA